MLSPCGTYILTGTYLYLYLDDHQVPFDVVPEGIFGIFGYVDDIVVVLHIVLYMALVYRRRVLEVQQENAPPAAAATR